MQKFRKERSKTMANQANTLAAATLLNHLPALTFSKEAATGKYIACNQAFAEYANKTTPEGVIGLTDFEIFDPVTAAHFVEDDKKTLSMEVPYVFYEDVPDASGTVIRHLQTTKQRFTDESGRLCTLGICTDVTEMVDARAAEAEMRGKQAELEKQLELQKQLLEEERNREQQDKMITALSSDYRSVYYVDLDRDEAICYRADTKFEEAPALGVRFPYLRDFTEFAENHYIR